MYIQSTDAMPFSLPLDPNATAAPSAPQASPAPVRKSGESDTVTLTTPASPLDAEAAQAMAEVEQQLATRQEEALSAHSGLSYSRVMSLLEGL